MAPLANGCVCAYSMDEASGLSRQDLTGRGNTLTPSFTPASNTGPITLGAGTASQYFAGALARFGKWNRLLTSAEKTTLYNAGAGVKWSDISAGSLNDAVLYYNLDEASGDRADATSRNVSMTVTGGAPTRVTGPDGTSSAIHFDGASDKIATTDAADFRIGNFDFTMAIWANLDNTDSTETQVVDYFAGKATGDNVEWLFYYPYLTGRSRWQFVLGYETTDPNLVNIKATNAGKPTAATWYFLLVEYDTSTNTISITVNNTNTDSFSPVAVPDRSTLSGPVYGSRFVDSGNFDDQTVPSGRVGPKHCYRASNGSDDLSIGNADATVCGWFKLNSTAHDQQLMGKFNNSGSVMDWLVFWQQNTLSLFFDLSDGGGTNFTVAGISLNDTNLHFFAGRVTAGSAVSMSLDNGTPDATAIAGYTPASNSVQFQLGAVVNGNGNNSYLQFVGVMGWWAKWNRVLSDAEITTLYEQGPGVPYPFIPTKVEVHRPLFIANRALPGILLRP